MFHCMDGIHIVFSCSWTFEFLAVWGSYKQTSMNIYLCSNLCVPPSSQLNLSDSKLPHLHNGDQNVTEPKLVLLTAWQAGQLRDRL